MSRRSGRAQGNRRDHFRQTRPLPPGAVHIKIPLLRPGDPKHRDAVREALREAFPDAPEMTPEEFFKQVDGLPEIELPPSMDV